MQDFFKKIPLLSDQQPLFHFSDMKNLHHYGIFSLTTFAIVCLLAVSSLAQEVLYVGTYSVRGSEGIYAYTFDREQQTFELLQTSTTLESPSFLAFSPDGQHLYSTNRGGVGSQPDAGSVSAFAIAPASGKLTALNEVSSYGISPCHVEVDDEGNWLYVSHYGGGSLSVFPIGAEGEIGELADSVQHTGGSVNEERQSAPHVHSIQPIPQSDYFIVADLGLDQLKIYQMDEGDISAAPIPYIATEPGAGPRHFVQAEGTPYIYVAEEMTSTVSVHTLDMQQEETRQIQRLSTLPDDFSGSNSVADIHISSDGKFLYVSNRGHNSLAIFEVNAEDGTLTPRGHQSSMGEIPRNFMIDPKGEFVLVANQDTDNVVFFQRDTATGQLTPTGMELSVPSPVCLMMTDTGQGSTEVRK